MEAPGAKLDWNSLPVNVLVKILTFVQKSSLADLLNAASVCSQWKVASENGEVWRSVSLPVDDAVCNLQAIEKVLQKFSRFFQNVCLNVNQENLANREAALRCLTYFSTCPTVRKYHSLEVGFTGQNPLFYAGQEFHTALCHVFSDHSKDGAHNRKFFRRLDFHRMPIKLTDDLLDAISQQNFLSLIYLDVQNRQLICHVTRSCLKQLAKVCRKLVDLRISYVSCSNDLLIFLSEAGRSKMRHLSLTCRRQEKYDFENLTDESWLVFKNFNHFGKVTLKFDQSCTVEKMRGIMKPCIPVHYLFLECYNTPLDIFNAAEFYGDFLEKFVVQTKCTDDFEQTLLDVVSMCLKLRNLHVMCVISHETLSKIFESRPDIEKMVAMGQSTLKCTAEPHPWVSDEKLDEIVL